MPARHTLHMIQRETTTDCAGVSIECDPLRHHQEHKPAKYAEQEQNLRNELHKDADIVLGMAGEREGDTHTGAGRLTCG